MNNETLRRLGSTFAIVTFVAILAVWWVGRESSTDFASAPIAVVPAEPSAQPPVEPPDLPADAPAPAPAPVEPAPGGNVPENAVRFGDRPLEPLPPPPAQGVVDIASRPMYTPRTVEPSVRDLNNVLASLQREYPPMLRQAGVEGTVLVFLLIDENGRTEQAQVARSSGYAQFDEAALRVARLIEFNPAMNRQDRVRVWAQIPVGFAIQR